MFDCHLLQQDLNNLVALSVSISLNIPKCSVVFYFYCSHSQISYPYYINNIFIQSSDSIRDLGYSLTHNFSQLKISKKLAARH